MHKPWNLEVPDYDGALWALPLPQFQLPWFYPGLADIKPNLSKGLIRMNYNYISPYYHRKSKCMLLVDLSFPALC